ncbi:MAG: Peptidoglycan binding protein [Parcubacteria group bacterium Gr01-1014_20]|nr:MAG: Peptidoglycan binding protein [Parcubacteria group bacterium Gr01-1014_20]
MTKKINVSKISFVSVGTLLALVLILSATTQKAHAAITSQLDLGSTVSDVAELQQFLATNSFIYPAGIVSGYFGPLTQAAVVQFQVAYGIPQVGRVGPMTMAKINSIMSSGFGLDISAPIKANASVQANRTDATIGWTTNELARGQVYYDTLPIRSDEATGHAQQAYVSGVFAPNNTNTQNSQSVTIQGLQPNTLYYYLTRAIDNSGNLSMSVQNTFRTN